MSRLIFRLLSAIIGFSGVWLDAYATPDTAEPDAQVVHLRANKPGGSSGCYETANGNELSNCFTSMANLSNWIAVTRKPSATASLLVDIGPGTFGSLTLNCNNTFGYTTFQGSGRKNTVIGGLGSSNVFGQSIQLTNCTSMIFQDLTIGPMLAAGGGGIRWTGIGTSVWQNIDVFGAQGFGWKNTTTGCSATSRGAHYWFGSRIVVTGNGGSSTAYTAQCAEEWLFGSEVTINANTSVNSSGGGRALLANGSNSEVHFLSGAIRTIVGAGVTAPAFSLPTGAPLGFASAIADGGKIFISGSGIDVLSAQPNAVGVLGVKGSGEIQANSAAYNLDTGANGTITRILNAGGTVKAAYQWEPHEEVPFMSKNVTLISVTGADTAVVTNTLDTRPHLVIYDESCTSSRWFDLVTNECRQQSVP